MGKEGTHTIIITHKGVTNHITIVPRNLLVKNFILLGQKKKLLGDIVLAKGVLGLFLKNSYSTLNLNMQYFYEDGTSNIFDEKGDEATTFIKEKSCRLRKLTDLRKYIKNTAVITTPLARAVSHTIIGAISAFGVLNISLREPGNVKRRKVVGVTKRKSPEDRISVPKGTTSGHYLNFINDTMDIMDEFPEMRGFFHRYG